MVLCVEAKPSLIEEYSPMARAPATSDDNGTTEYKPWVPPKADEEFKFESPDSVPEWADKSWASYDRGPALAVPGGDLWGEGPYHTKVARVGDTVKFVAATPSKHAHFEVIEGEPTDEGNITKRPPAYTNASLEDMIKTGWLSVDDLGADAKAQVAHRSPRLAQVMEGETDAQIAKPVEVGSVLKTS